MLGLDLSRILLFLFLASGCSTSSPAAAGGLVDETTSRKEDQASESSWKQTSGVEPETTQKPDLCRSPVDAISVIREEYHIFSGQWFWRVNSRNGVLRDDPMKINHMWYYLPNKVNQIDAVYERNPNGKIVFFIGSIYWELDDNRSSKFSKSGRVVTDLGLPETVTTVDAAFVWPRDNRTYLIVGDMLWRLNASGTGVDGEGQRMILDPASKLKPPIDAAFKDLSGDVHFVKGDYFWTVTDLANISITYPRLRNESGIFGCNRPAEIGSMTHKESASSPINISYQILAIMILVLNA